jgi:hypothetical protein
LDLHVEVAYSGEPGWQGPIATTSLLHLEGVVNSGLTVRLLNELLESEGEFLTIYLVVLVLLRNRIQSHHFALVYDRFESGADFYLLVVH